MARRCPSTTTNKCWSVQPQQHQGLTGATQHMCWEQHMWKPAKARLRIFTAAPYTHLACAAPWPPVPSSPSSGQRSSRWHSEAPPAQHQAQSYTTPAAAQSPVRPGMWVRHSSSSRVRIRRHKACNTQQGRSAYVCWVPTLPSE